MNIINQVETFIQSIEISQIIDLIIALAVIIAFLVFSPLFSYYLTRLFYRKEELQHLLNILQLQMRQKLQLS
jgi:hypothetical protein